MGRPLRVEDDEGHRQQHSDRRADGGDEVEPEGHQAYGGEGRVAGAAREGASPPRKDDGPKTRERERSRPA